MTDKALEAARQAIRYLSHPETPWSDEQVQAVISAYLSTLGEAEVVGRDIFECANQLGGYVGPNTDDELARFLLRESNAAADLAYEIVRLRGALQAMQARAEKAEEALRVSELEGDAAFALAVDDPGKNPPVTWKSRAEAAEARAQTASTGWADALNDLEAAEARAKELEEEVANLRAATNQSRLAFSGMVSVQSAIDLLDKLGGSNG